MNAGWFDEQSRLLRQIVEAQARILACLNQTPSRSWYTPAEFGQIVNRCPSTIRRLCREGRITARKRLTGRADKLDWEIDAAELVRFQNHGRLVGESHGK